MKPDCWRTAAVSLSVFLAALSAATVGCGGGDTVDVSGRVTLDDQPLDNAFISFAPVSEGIPAYGKTDADGHYSLQYTRDQTGVAPGEYVVSIWTFSSGDPDSDPPEPAQEERVPTKYNRNTELKATVEPGGGEINFDLDAQGEIQQGDPSEQEQYEEGTCC